MVLSVLVDASCIVHGDWWLASGQDPGALVLVELEVEADVDLYVDRWSQATPTTAGATATVAITASAAFDPHDRALDHFSLGRIVIDVDRILGAP